MEEPTHSERKEAARRHYHQDDAPPRLPTDWQSLIEEQIARLDTDNLPGKGKPLNLARNPYVSEADELAHGLLKNAGFTLPWIDDSRRIDTAVAAARAKLAAAHADYLTARDAEMCSGPQWIEGLWLRAVQDFRGQVEQLNRQIRDFNLKVPTLQLHKLALKIEDELAMYGE
ncbi:MAG: DnaJ family domain-containing protein [Caldilineales bacterium]